MSRLAVALLTLWSGTAVSAPVVWQLQNVVFNDGGTAHGSFVYDADTGIMSDVAITTTNGTIPLPDGAELDENDNWVPVYSIFPGSNWWSGTYSVSGFDGAHRLSFYLDTVPPAVLEGPYSLAFTLAGEPIDSSQAYTLLGGGESGYVNEPGLYRSVISGQITSVVPIPAAAWLFASGLGMLGWLRARERG